MRPFTVLMLCVVLGNAELLYKDVIIKTFPGQADSKFSNLAVEKNHGWVFIGDVNRLYQLNENLESVVEYKTGPKEDSLDCLIPNTACSSGKKLTNNYNKALIVDYSTPTTRLMSCGSIYQGFCELHKDINNISSQVEQVYQSVVANDDISSTVAFIGPGSMDLSFSSLVLYVGATNTDNSNYQKQMPLVASRSLEMRNLLQIAKEGRVHGTKIRSVDPKYTINYIFGFSSELFTYFLTTQMKSADSSSFVSKLIRICNEDDQYSSYTEIPIECTGNDGRNYNLAQAAFKTRLDPTYAKLLGLDISSDNDVLFALFSQSEEVSKPSKYGALCVYSVKAMNREFVKNIKMCSKPDVCRSPKYIAPDGKLNFNEPYNIDEEDFCRVEVDTDTGIEIVDTQLQGSMPLRSEPLFTNKTLMLTAIAATPIDKVGLVVYLGTREGYLKEIVFENSTNPREIGDIFIGESSVNPHMQFDSRVNHLYVMTKNKLVKIKIHDGDKNENDAFSNCPKYTSCTACVSSRFRCNWCLTKHQCIYNEDKNAEYNSVLSNEFCNEQRGSIGPKYCPAIISDGNGKSDILIAAGTSRSIELKTKMIDQFLKTKQFLCNFSIEDRVITVRAVLSKDGVIHCDQAEFTFLQHKSNLTVGFDVLWGDWRPLDHLNNIRLILYNCSQLASNCNTCLALGSEYECGWCGDKCQTLSGCKNRSYNWWGRNHSCSNPTITHFEPQYGWWYEQNSITIQGINLCSTIDNVCSVTVAGEPCIPIENSAYYKPPTTIFCQRNQTPKLLENKNNPGPVVVQMGKLSANSAYNFTIIELSIMDISPKQGPLSGGTELSLKGSFMDVGNFIGAFVDEIACKVFERNSREMKCITGASENILSGNVNIKFNFSNKAFVHINKSVVFKYLTDPIIGNFVFDDDNLDQAPKSIQAGGIKLFLRGQNLNLIQNPLFYVYNKDVTKRYKSECQVLNSSMMSCFTPFISDINSSSINQSNPIRLHYGFVMDSVIHVQNISKKNIPEFKMLMLYPNPTFIPFSNREFKISSIGDVELLLLGGENINSVCQKTDIIVKAGNRNCRVEYLSADVLTCRLSQPSITNGSARNSDDSQDVIVSIGHTFQVNVGKLMKNDESSNLTTSMILISIPFIFFMITICIILFFIKFHRKSLDYELADQFHLESLSNW